MINVTRSSMPLYEEYCEEIRPLWESRHLTNSGEKHRLFEEKLKEYLSVLNVTLYTNGHLALEHILDVFNFPRGAEVITTPFTFASTTHAIVRNGLVPVFADIKRDDYTINADIVENLITDKTVAILPVHVYGNLCDVKRLQDISKKHNLKLIYDAAHAFGVECDGVSSACFGDASMFSFHATKVFHTIEGGALTYSDSNLIPLLNSYKNFGITSPEDVSYIGANAKMNEFQASMGICNLRHIDEEILKRKAVVERYRENLSGIGGIKICPEKENVKSNYAYFPVLFDGFKKDRDEVFEELGKESITARKYFYPLTNSFACYKNTDKIHSSPTPVAEYVSQRVLTLPLYADLALEDVDKICNIIKR